MYWSEQRWDEMFLPVLEMTVHKYGLREQPSTEN